MDDFDQLSQSFYDNVSESSNSALDQRQQNFRATFEQSLKENEQFTRVASRASRRDVDPLRESSMSFFKEAFSNSQHPKAESMSNFYLKEKRRQDDSENNSV